MKRHLMLSLLALLPVWTAAGDEFHFTYSGTAYSASGDLTATNNGDGSYTVTSGSGTFDGYAISLMPGAGGDAYFAWDNLIFPGHSSTLDVDGLLFSINALGANELNFCANGPGCDSSPNNYTAYLNTVGDPNTYITDTGNFTLTHTGSTGVPEPATGAFLAMGLLAVCALRRQFSHSSGK